MIRITITKEKKTTFTDATSAFLKRCYLNNLRQETIKFYQEDINFFQHSINKQYISDVNQNVFDDFLASEIAKGKKITSLNTRIRGLKVFFSFCQENNFMPPLKVKLMKEENTIKETYTVDEIQRLIERPQSNNWVELRTWASINYMVATGNRINTLLNIKISDIDFDKNTIFLKTVKNRNQQIIPLSSSLKEVLLFYLGRWEHTPENYLFPNCFNEKLSKKGFQDSIAKYHHLRGVSKTSCHLYRHFFAKQIILNGGGMVQLQTLLGHSSLDMSKKYVNIYGLDLKKDYEKINPLDTITKKKGN